MNKDIEIMIKLQGYWDRVLSSRAQIEKAMVRVHSLEKELDAEKAAMAASEKKIKEMKSAVKQDELSLVEMSNRKLKLEERKTIIHTEKELQALEKEIDLITLDISALEDKTLGMIDDLDAMSRQGAAIGESIKEKERVFSEEKLVFEKETAGHKVTVRDNEEKFNAIVESLNPLYKSKFLKMIKSKDGTGIARVDGEICGNCNFKIPSHLAIDAGNREKVVICTNCGKYIYK